MATAKKKKAKKKTLLRRLSNIRSFEMGGVPRGANREEDWLVCKEDDDMKLDLTKTTQALEMLQRVATVLKSGEPAADAQAALHKEMEGAMQLLASQGVSLDGIDREALRANLAKLQTSVAAVIPHERDMNVAEELDEIQEAIQTMGEQLEVNEQLEAAKRKKKEAPQAEEPAATEEPAPDPEPAPKPEPAPAPTPTPAAADTPPPPATTQTPVPDVPPEEELVSKADLQGFLGEMTKQFKTLTESIGTIQKKVETVEGGLATVNKQLDPGAVPSIVGRQTEAPTRESEEDWPLDMNDLSE